jgi:hypothetical protein
LDSINRIAKTWRCSVMAFGDHRFNFRGDQSSFYFAGISWGRRFKIFMPNAPLWSGSLPMSSTGS